MFRTYTWKQSNAKDEQLKVLQNEFAKVQDAETRRVQENGKEAETLKKQIASATEEATKRREEILKKDACIHELEEELRRLKESLQVVPMPRS